MCSKIMHSDKNAFIVPLRIDIFVSAQYYINDMLECYR